MTTAPAIDRDNEAPDRSTATSRSAAIGAIREARRAGSTAEATVTTTPTVKAAIIEGAAMTAAPSGRSTASAERTARSPLATPMPARMPRPDATTPVTRASIRIERRTWPPLAPIARNIAISLDRWATVMEKVLLMMKAPTKIAIPAKISRKILKGPNSLAKAAWSSAISC